MKQGRITGKKLILGCLILVVALSVIAMRLRIVPVLIIKNSQNKTVARLPLYDGQFIHHYIHSIHKTAVDEYFQIKGRNLELFQVKYDTYGVGMPSDGGEAFAIEDGRFVVKMHRTFFDIPILVSIVPQHGVIVEDELFLFTQWVLPESRITLSAGRMLIFYNGRSSPK
ncbi:MAG TPA: DUF1850 domain-containing protein [Rectinema sp.]|nr:DUF1850 domain-containing protein [Rectinema sp.]